MLPALTHFSYDGMQIAEGTAASKAFTQLRLAGETVDDYNDDMKQLRTALLAYCKQDTLSMAEILKELRGMV